MPHYSVSNLRSRCYSKYLESIFLNLDKVLSQSYKAYIKKYGVLHEFACPPSAGAVLIISVSFQFQYMRCQSEHLSLFFNISNVLRYIIIKDFSILLLNTLKIHSFLHSFTHSFTLCVGGVIPHMHATALLQGPVFFYHVHPGNQAQDIGHRVSLPTKSSHRPRLQSFKLSK